MPKRNRHREQSRSFAPTALPTGTETSLVPPRDVAHVDTPDEARALADRLLIPGRRWPVVVVTIPSNQTEPYVDAERVKREIGDLGEVLVLPTSDASWAFSNRMPPMTQVYGGAGRVYGVDHDWVADPYRSPLRFAYSASDSDRVGELLVSDALAAALRAGLVSAVPTADEPPVSGEVRSLIEPSIAMVVLDDDDGLPATLRADLFGLDLPVSRLVQPGQRVTGLLRGDVRRLEVRGMLRPPAEYLADYAVGDAILARVESVADDAAVLNPHPQVSVTVPRSRITDNPNDLISDLFTPGETVLAHVVAAAPALELRLDDVDDDSHVDVPPLIEGGPPWLVLIDPREARERASREADERATQEGVPGDAAGAARASAPALGAPAVLGETDRLVPPTPAQIFGGAHPATAGGVVEPATDDGPATPVPGDATGPAAPERRAPAPRVVQAKPVPVAPLFGATAADNEAERRQIAELKQDLDYVKGRLRHSEERLASREAELQTLKQKYRLADKRRQELSKKVQALSTRQEESTDDLTNAFADPEEQFRFEVRLAWARRVPAGQKADLPLAPYSLGPDFLATLESVGGVSRDKVVDVVVEVLTGTARSQAGREVHPLRVSDSGGSPYVVRPEDGAKAWRAALQRETAQARRLHYWTIGDHVELSRVVLHDDMTP